MFNLIVATPSLVMVAHPRVVLLIYGLSSLIFLLLWGGSFLPFSFREDELYKEGGVKGKEERGRKSGHRQKGEAGLKGHFCVTHWAARGALSLPAFQMCVCATICQMDLHFILSRLNYDCSGKEYGV